MHPAGKACVGGGSFASFTVLVVSAGVVHVPPLLGYWVVGQGCSRQVLGAVPYPCHGRSGAWSSFSLSLTCVSPVIVFLIS